MHTFHKRYGEDQDGNEASTWVVGFTAGDPSPILPIAEFMTEDEAASYVSFLNGGGGAETTPADARKELADRDEKIRKAKAAKEIKALEAAATQAAADAKAVADAKAAEVKAAQAVDPSGAKAAAHDDDDKPHGRTTARNHR